MHRAPAEHGVVPQHPGHHQRGRDHRGGRDPPGLRVPLGIGLPRGDLRGLQHPLHRSRAAGHPPDGGQEPGQEGDDQGRGAGGARFPGHRRRRGEGGQGRQGRRLPGDPQGLGGWRRPRDADRPPGRGPRPELPRGAGRGPGGLRGARRLHREVRRRSAPHRDPGDGGQQGQRGAPRRARVLHPAPAPEDHRGGSLRRRVGEAPPSDGKNRRGGGRRGAVRERGDDRVPARQGRQLLLHGDEHPDSGRARGDGARDRPGPREGTDSRRGGERRSPSPRRRSRSRAMPSSAGSTPRTP